MLCASCRLPGCRLFSPQSRFDRTIQVWFIRIKASNAPGANGPLRLDATIRFRAPGWVVADTLGDNRLGGVKYTRPPGAAIFSAQKTLITSLAGPSGCLPAVGAQAATRRECDNPPLPQSGCAARTLTNRFAAVLFGREKQSQPLVGARRRLVGRVQSSKSFRTLCVQAELRLEGGGERVHFFLRDLYAKV